MVEESRPMSRFGLSCDEQKLISTANTLNINIGVLGHIDSGKTSLAKALSVVTSTASLDKNPQSQERGITLDLGFSAFFTTIPPRLRESTKKDFIQFTLVDCPGHASLIRTIIGGASIIDIMFLVIDINKGIQTQTAECLVIGELLMSKLIVVLNKIDLIPEKTRAETITKKTDQLRKVFSKTKFGADLPIVTIAAAPSPSESTISSASLKIDDLIETLLRETDLPERKLDGPFFFLIDHCFPIKGKGSVVTGTAISGQYRVGEEVEFPLIKEVKKSKGIQMFKRPVDSICQGDRAGILFTQLDHTLIERGIACTPGLVTQVSFSIIPVTKVNYFKNAIQSKSKFHVTTGHQTCMAVVKLFKGIVPVGEEDAIVGESLSVVAATAARTNFKVAKKADSASFDFKKEYEFVENYDEFVAKRVAGEKLFALLEFEKPVFMSKNALLICSKFDSDITANVCRIAFHGNQIAVLTADELKHKKLTIYREKIKEGVIEKVNDNYTAIVKDLFKKESNIEIFINSPVEIERTKTPGKITSAFGKNGKVKVTFPGGIEQQNQNQMQQQPEDNHEDEESKEQQSLVGSKILLKFKKTLFHK